MEVRESPAVFTLEMILPEAERVASLPVGEPEFGSIPRGQRRAQCDSVAAGPGSASGSWEFTDGSRVPGALRRVELGAIVC